MKPLQIGLLVLVGALGGALIMKYTQRAKPVAAPVASAVPAPAPMPTDPAPAAARQPLPDGRGSVTMRPAAAVPMGHHSTTHAADAPGSGHGGAEYATGATGIACGTARSDSSDPGARCASDYERAGSGSGCHSGSVESVAPPPRRRPLRLPCRRASRCQSGWARAFRASTIRPATHSPLRWTLP
jgi:hypothetical protein